MTRYWVGGLTVRGKNFLLLCGVAAMSASPAFAAEALKFGKAPDWVVPTPIPDPQAKSDAPVALLLSDQQIAFEGGKSTTYAETVMRIQNPQGLTAGNISFSWNPATDTVTVNKLHILRGGKVIDVLASGQTFTVLRRESNLEIAMLDGTLTANIQPEGLQEGDTIDLATTVEHFDPVWKGHVEAGFVAWNELPVERGKARLIWPASIQMNVRPAAGLPPAQRSRKGDNVVLELNAQKVEPLVLPKGAPTRFAIGRLAEATDFGSWADLAELFIPLYRGAAVIPPTGPLRDELSRIHNSTSDPKARAEQALALVQDRVRYVALVMGQGSYVPAAADTTWSRRFGDCKAKTALLLGLLRELGIEAEPVLVNSVLGDAIGERLPRIALFNHVLVRAHIGGKTYWLDGTRTGDTHLDDIRAPNFGWGLPLVTNAALVHIIPPPLDVPNSETRAEVDATNGIYAPAPAKIETVLRGDAAVTVNNALASLTELQRQEYFRSYLKQSFDFVTFKSASYAFDKSKRELHVSMTGEAKFDWNGGLFHVPQSTVGFNPDFDRPAGPFHDAPFAVVYPKYDRTLTKFRMPRSFFAGRQLGSAEVHETLAGVEYSRTSKVNDDVLEIELRERSLVPEISYREAVAAEGRLKELVDEDVALPVPRIYRPTEKDLAALSADRPTSKGQFFQRALTLAQAGKFDEALADLNQAIALDPKNVWLLANRGLVYVHKKNLKAAETDLKAASAIDPNNSVVLRARALMAEQNGDCAPAIEHYTKSLSVEPGNNFALGHRAQCERSMGKDAEALADSERALKADPSWMDLRVMRANIFLAQGKNDAVAREAELLVQENPNADYAYVAAGRIYARIDRRGDAMKAFDRALAIKPESYIYVNRAQSRPFTDYAGRLADLDAALKLDPNNADAIAEKAEQLAARGDLKGALQLYNQVIKVTPDNPYMSLRRAIVLYKTGSTEEASKILADRRSKAKTPADLNNLCWTKATAGILLESALQDCLEALRMKPNQGPAIDSLAFVKLRMGKFDEAIALYDQAIEKKTGSASYMGRAIAYARKGDNAHAQADRAEALRLDGDAETRFAEYGVKF